MIDKKYNFYWIPFLIGILATNNIVYAFVVGSTPILLSSLYAFLAFAYLRIFRPSKVSVQRCITQDMRLFFLFASLSVIVVLAFHVSYIYQWFVGIINLTLVFITIIVTSASFEKRDLIYRGLAIGIFINFLIVIYSYVMFSRGIIFSFQDIFPNAGIRNMYLSNAFRAWGLFKEPGHLMRFIAIISLIVIPYYLKKNKVIGLSLVLMVFVIAAFTRSSAVAIFIVGLVGYYLLSDRTNPKRKIRSLVAIVLCILVVALFLSRTSIGTVIYQSLMFGVEDLLTSGGTVNIRTNGITSSLLVLKEYPLLGAGWGTITKVFMEMGLYTDSVRGTYSYALSLLCQIGIFCAPFYYFLISKSLNLLGRRNDTEATGIACSLLMFMILTLITDFALDPSSAVLIGLAIGKSRERREYVTN